MRIWAAIIKTESHKNCILSIGYSFWLIPH
jgi:hypothetical protein